MELYYKSSLYKEHYNVAFFQMYPFSSQKVPSLPFLFKYPSNRDNKFLKVVEYCAPTDISVIDNKSNKFFQDQFHNLQLS